MHRHSRACIQHVRKRFIWVGTKSPSESSECPFCPFCPISMRWAFHTNLNQQSSILLSGLCEVAHLYRHSMADTKHLRKHFIWVGTRSPSESSECPFCPFCPFCPTSMRRAFHTNLNLTSIMLSELCEVEHLHRHLRRHFDWVGTRSPSESRVSVLSVLSDFDVMSIPHEPCLRLCNWKWDMRSGSYT